MKTLKKISVLAFLTIGQFAMAQKPTITELTHYYYGIKNALIADDGKTAGEQAALFLKTVNAINGLTASQQKVWAAQKPALIAAAEAISKTTDVGKQREQLNQLSVSLFTVLKTLKANDKTVYYQYCPMKKAYWLSSEKEIKNPYYGNKMLTCGSVKETLK